MRSAQNIFLVRPASFGFNCETAKTNSFQNKTVIDDLQKKVRAEFDAFAKALTNAGIGVTVFDDSASPLKPDAVFPNNWISIHSDGTLVLYPMCTPNRRTERRADIVEELKNKFVINKVIDLSIHEKENHFLEGTGSIVFDHTNKVAYACLSPRTDKDIFVDLVGQLGYRLVSFTASDKNGAAIYHTNVMMCISEGFAMICSESISDKNERNAVLSSLSKGGLDIVEISYEQMDHFAGNMLGLKSGSGELLLVLSKSAFDFLAPQQKERIEKHARLLPLAIPSIETIGGGSARCMIAEIFAPAR